MIVRIIIFLLGIVLLYFGSEAMVRGSARLAISLGIRPVIIGLTLVAFGTSAPELFVGFVAALNKYNDIAIGNVLGSNIANIGLIVGIAALVSPLQINTDILRKEMPMMIFASIVLGLMALDLEISSLEGLILLLGMLLFTLYTILDYLVKRRSRVRVDFEKKEVGESEKYKNRRIKIVGLAIIGLIGLLLGAEMVVRSAVYIAREVGISELIVGLTVIAVGTSLPELAVSTVSAHKKESEISIGNVIGSNIFNILLVIGVVASIRPITIDKGVLTFEIPAMLIFSFLLFYVMKTGNVVNRFEGALLLVGYIGFFVWLF